MTGRPPRSPLFPPRPSPDQSRRAAPHARGVGAGLARDAGEQLFDARRFRTPEPRVLAIDVVDDLADGPRSEEHTSELQSRLHLVCRLLLEKKKTRQRMTTVD